MMAEIDPTPPPNAGRGWFATTRWTVVLAAGEGPSPEAREALEVLCSAYWQPLHAYVLRKGYGPEEAKDLTQQFFLRMLQGDRLARANRDRGRFRTYLLTALNHFLINEWIKEGRQKRGGGVEFVALSAGDSAALNAVEPVDPGTPELNYDRQWASVVLSLASERLKGYYPGDRAVLLEALQPFVWGEKTDSPQAEVAASLGLNEGAVRTAIYRLRRAYRDCLRTEIAQTVSSLEEVDEELRHLIRIVSQPGA